MLLNRYRHVEIGHPVYALLFQCVTVQACGQGLSLLALALTGRSWCSPREWEQVNGFVRIVVRQFYEVTWAAVTHLRWEVYDVSNFSLVRMLFVGQCNHTRNW